MSRLSDEEAYQTFKLIRWASTEGEPVCPRCGCVATYTYATRKLFKCKGYNHQFSVTSGTIFASRKLPDTILSVYIDSSTCINCLVRVVNAPIGPISKCPVEVRLRFQNTEQTEQKVVYILPRHGR